MYSPTAVSVGGSILLWLLLIHLQEREFGGMTFIGRNAIEFQVYLLLQSCFLVTLFYFGKYGNNQVIVVTCYIYYISVIRSIVDWTLLY